MLIATDAAVKEAQRVMEVCNACRYCEGVCATFQAMALRRTFSGGDLDYLANLCHNCTACYHDCQYAAPHDFDINVPVALADLRVDSYTRYAWPGFLARAFERNGLITAVVTTISITVLLALAMLFINASTLFGQHVGPGSFYKVVGHGLMVATAGLTFGFAILAMIIGGVRFWRATGGGPLKLRNLLSAGHYAATLKYLDGGHGDGCSTVDDRASNLRRIYHQFTMWGFLLCFAATCVATVYDYGLGLVAPYPFFSVPVLLGTIGGVGLLIGPVGLVWNKLKSDPRPLQLKHFGMDYAFLGSLFLVSLTGLLLLAFRETSAMGVLLIIHLGFVLGFFLLLPYSKFVHAVYRFAALAKFAGEKR